MDNFEERMLCHYLLEAKNDFCISSIEFRDFYLDIKTKLKLKASKFPEYKNGYTDEIIEFETAFFDCIKTNSNILRIRKTKIEKKIEKISKIYNLTDLEHKIFTYYTLMIFSTKIKNLHTLLAKQDAPFFAICLTILKMNYYNADMARKSLLDKGLFVKFSMCDSKVELSGTIRAIIENDLINTELQIKEALLGKKQKSTLKWTDFDFLENKKDLASKLLSASCKNKKMGINILLYGTVGSGKTEFAKLLANNTQIDMFSVISKQGKKEALREERLQDLYSKQAILERTNNSCILFDEAEDVMNRGFSEYGKASKSYLNQIIEKTPVPIIWTTNNILDVDPAFLRRITYSIEFEKLSEETRLTIWEKAVKKK